MEDKEELYEAPGVFSQLVGWALMFVAVLMLLYIENVSVGMKKEIAGLGWLIVDKVDTTEAAPVNDGKIVYFGAWTQSNDTVRDPLYGVGGRFLAIRRTVEYYQWVEQETKEYDKQEDRYHTYYEYNKAWTEPVDSRHFDEEYGHENVTPLTIEPLKVLVSGMKMGPYAVDRTIREGAARMAEEPLTFDMEMKTARQVFAQKIPWKKGPDIRTHLLGNEIYYGEDPERPQIGDVRVRFIVSKPVFLYVMAQVDGDRLQPYQFSTLADKDGFKMDIAPFDPHETVSGDLDGYTYLSVTCRIIAWLLIVWAMFRLKGMVVYPLRRMYGVGKIVPEANSGWTLWVVGTYLAIVAVVVCNLIARLTA